MIRSTAQTPTSPPKDLCVRLTPDIRRALDRIAEAETRTLGSVVRSIIVEDLRKRGAYPIADAPRAAKR